MTAIVRSEAKRPSLRHDRLRVMIGDPCDPKFLMHAFKGQDAVISALGGRSPTKTATSVYWKSADAITEAAWNSGLKRIAVTSTALLFPSDRFADRVLKRLVPNVVQSATRMERTLQHTQLDVTVGRCGFLTDAQEQGYRAAQGTLPQDGASVSRLSLARFLVDRIREASSGLTIYGVSRPA